MKILVSKDSFEDVMRLISNRTILSLDTETTGLSPYKGDRLFSIIIGDGENEYYFNFNPRHSQHDLLDRSIISSLLPESHTIFLHNAKFDMHFLYKEGLDLSEPRFDIHCTQAIGRVVQNNLLSYSLENLAGEIGYEKSKVVEEFILKNKLYKIVQVPGKRKKEKNKFYDQVPFDLMFEYGCRDAEITYKLGMHQIERLHKRASGNLAKVKTWDVVEQEKKLTKILFNMERVGVKIDREYTIKAKDYETNNIRRAEADFRNFTGVPFKDSNKVLADAFSKIGENYPLTEKGNPSFKDEVLSTMTSPLAKIVQDYRAAYKKANTYYENFLQLSDDCDLIHTNFRQGGTASGRMSCIAQGQPVSVIGGTKPIEDIEVGEYVYTYSEEGKLELKKVIAKNYMGIKKTVKVNWKSQGTHSRGTLICTPDHKILCRKITTPHAVKSHKEGWYRADELTKNDRVYHLTQRISNGRHRLFSVDQDGVHEQILIKEQIFNSSDHKNYHIHHKDYNSLNNSLDNLEVLSAKEHLSLHGKDNPSPSFSGPDNANYIHVTKIAFLRNCISFYRQGEGNREGWSVLKGQAKKMGVSLRTISRRFNKNGEFINSLKLKNLLQEYPHYLVEKELGVDYRTLRKVEDDLDIVVNHKVMSIEDHVELPVWDLTIEDNHNFIVSEICVHNCSEPNLQNLNKEETLSEYMVRKCFVPRDGYNFVMIDYDQMEYRMMLDYAGEMSVINQVLNGVDVHTATAQIMDVSRKEAKTINFMLLYGGGVQKLADALGCSFDEAKRKKDNYFTKLPKVSSFIRQVIQQTQINRNCFNWMGRVYEFPDTNFAYKAPNYLIQGNCADVVKKAMVSIAEYLRDKKSEMLIQIHDELLFEVAHDEMWIVPQLKLIMEQAYVPEYLPLTVGVEFSEKNWQEKEAYEGD